MKHVLCSPLQSSSPSSETLKVASPFMAQNVLVASQAHDSLLVILVVCCYLSLSVGLEDGEDDGYGDFVRWFVYLIKKEKKNLVRIVAYLWLRVLLNWLMSFWFHWNWFWFEFNSDWTLIRFWLDLSLVFGPASNTQRENASGVLIANNKNNYGSNDLNEHQEPDLNANNT